MYSIGEFSRIVSLPIKTIRYYHEQGLLIPAHVEPETGYRSFNDANIDTANTIKTLREFGFTVRNIATILQDYEEDVDILTFLQDRSEQIQQELKHLSDVEQALKNTIQITQRNHQMVEDTTYEIEEKTVAPILVAGIRMRGKYSDCGAAFKSLGKSVGRYMNGKPLMLCYDTEYKEDDADFEPCMAIRNPQKPVDAVSIRELPGGRFATLIHKGTYDSLGNSYKKLLAYLQDRGYSIQTPSREVYIKGPGMIFKGNPKKYLTEIQFPIREQG